MPEREMPGCSAHRLRDTQPEPGPGRERVEASASLGTRWSTYYSTTPKMASITAINHGWPAVSWIGPSSDGAHDHPRDRAQHQRPCQALVHVVDRAPRAASGRTPSGSARGRGGSRSTAPSRVPMCRATSKVLFRSGSLHDRPAEHPRHQDQVSRAGDGRVLGRALHDAQHDRLQDAHVAATFRGGRRGTGKPPMLAAGRRDHLRLHGASGRSGERDDAGGGGPRQALDRGGVGQHGDGSSRPLPTRRWSDGVAARGEDTSTAPRARRPPSRCTDAAVGAEGGEHVDEVAGARASRAGPATGRDERSRPGRHQRRDRPDAGARRAGYRVTDSPSARSATSTRPSASPGRR